MTEQELKAAGYTKVDSLTRSSAWVAGETGDYFIYDNQDETLRSLATGDMLIRLVLRGIEGSGSLVGGTA